MFDKLSVGTQPDRFQERHDRPFGTDGQFFATYGYQRIFKGDKNA